MAYRADPSIALAGFLAFFLLALWLIPLLGIWSVRGLFGLDTPYTAHTWLASLVFFSLTGGVSTKRA